MSQLKSIFRIFLFKILISLSTTQLCNLTSFWNNISSIANNTVSYNPECQSCDIGCAACISIGTPNLTLPFGFTLSTNSVCINCDKGYYWDSTYTCKACSIGCSSCVGNSIKDCLDIKNNFVYSVTDMEYNACNIQNCLDCGGGLSTCWQCNSGYFLNDSQQCQACSIDNCSRCLSNGTCLACKEKFFLDGGSCISCPNNCIACSSTQKCLICDPGYVQNSPDPNSNCILKNRVIDGTDPKSICAYGTFPNPISTYKCYECARGYGLILSTSNCQGFFYIQPLTQLYKACSIYDCVKCDGNSAYCTECIKGKVAINGTCWVVNYIPGCLQYDIAGQICLQCTKGYFNNGTNCAQCSESCATCIGPLVSHCTSCRGGLFLLRNYYSMDDYKNIYKLSNITGICVNDCSSVDPIWEQEFSINLTSQLLNSTIYGNFTSNINISILNQGVKWNMPILNGFNRSRSIEILILQQTVNFTRLGDINFIETIADSIPANLQIPYSNTISSKIQSSEIFFNDITTRKCRACMPNCINCTSPYQCNACVSGYYIQQNSLLIHSTGHLYITDICKKCHPSCATCNGPLPGNCLSCPNDAQLLPSKYCVTPISCSIGKYLNTQSGVCENCPQNCDKCLNEQICTSCSRKFGIKSDGTCELCSDSNCQICNSKNWCDLCSIGTSKQVDFANNRSTCKAFSNTQSKCNTNFIMRKYGNYDNLQPDYTKFSPNFTFNYLLDILFLGFYDAQDNQPNDFDINIVDQSFGWFANRKFRNVINSEVFSWTYMMSDTIIDNMNQLISISQQDLNLSLELYFWALNNLNLPEMGNGGGCPFTLPDEETLNGLKQNIQKIINEILGNIDVDVDSLKTSQLIVLLDTINRIFKPQKQCFPIQTFPKTPASRGFFDVLFNLGEILNVNLTSYLSFLSFYDAYLDPSNGLVMPVCLPCLSNCTSCPSNYYLNNSNCVLQCPFPLKAMNNQCVNSSDFTLNIEWISKMSLISSSQSFFRPLILNAQTNSIATIQWTVLDSTLNNLTNKIFQNGTNNKAKVILSSGWGQPNQSYTFTCQAKSQDNHVLTSSIIIPIANYPSLSVNQTIGNFNDSYMFMVNNVFEGDVNGTLLIDIIDSNFPSRSITLMMNRTGILISTLPWSNKPRNITAVLRLPTYGQAQKSVLPNPKIGIQVKSDMANIIASNNLNLTLSFDRRTNTNELILNIQTKINQLQAYSDYILALNARLNINLNFNEASNDSVYYSIINDANCIDNFCYNSGKCINMGKWVCICSIGLSGPACNTDNTLNMEFDSEIANIGQALLNNIFTMDPIQKILIVSTLSSSAMDIQIGIKTRKILTNVIWSSLKNLYNIYNESGKYSDPISSLNYMDTSKIYEKVLYSIDNLVESASKESIINVLSIQNKLNFDDRYLQQNLLKSQLEQISFLKTIRKLGLISIMDSISSGSNSFLINSTNLGLYTQIITSTNIGEPYILNITFNLKLPFKMSQISNTSTKLVPNPSLMIPSNIANTTQKSYLSIFLASADIISGIPNSENIRASHVVDFVILDDNMVFSWNLATSPILLRIPCNLKSDIDNISNLQCVYLNEKSRSWHTQGTNLIDINITDGTCGCEIKHNGLFTILANLNPIVDIAASFGYLLKISFVGISAIILNEICKSSQFIAYPIIMYYDK